MAALFMCFSSILRYRSPLSQIECAAAEDFCKTVLKVAFLTEFEVDVSDGVKFRYANRAEAKANIFQRIAFFRLKNPGRPNFLSRLKNLDPLKNLKRLRPFSRLRSS